MARDFKTIGVIGLGTMGAGIAEVFARNGYAVVGVEVSEETLQRGRQHLEHSTRRAVARGKLSEADQQQLLERITLTTELGDVRDADLVVEAVVESLEVKKSLFRRLDEIVAPDAVLATNTSSLSVTEISTASSATSTTRCRCTRASTPPARTSMPRCGSAAVTRWGRWRCST
jgi:3-hydroxybutyryl-CoA dehydrogenase